jgi:hypothetical protein
MILILRRLLLLQRQLIQLEVHRCRKVEAESKTSTKNQLKKGSGKSCC